VIVTGAVVATLAFATTTTAAKVLLADGPMTKTGLECPTTGSASPAACPTAVPRTSPTDGPAHWPTGSRPEAWLPAGTHRLGHSRIACGST
jgi:hypothetical protein